jgi:hypothetical protein
MAFNDQVKGFVNNLMASFFYDVLKSLLGAGVVAIGVVVWRYLPHRPSDWWGIACLVGFVAVVFVGLQRIHRKDEGQNVLASVEETVERILAQKGLSPEVTQSAAAIAPSEPVGLSLVPTPKFDGEIYRVVRSDKSAFSDLTRQLWESVNPGKVFEIDIDILVEMYLVNTSSETQYIRDFSGSVEIDGLRVALVREKDFSAFEFNDEQWEYCLDPSPQETPILMAGRSETMTPVFSNFPMTLQPGQPIEGWIRFLLKERDPRKLDENRTYKFILKDSLGVEYEVSRSANPQRTTPPVKSRKRRVSP